MDESVWRMASRKTSRPTLGKFGDLRDLPLEDSKVEDLRSLKVSRRLTQAAPSPSRFLKRNQALGEKHLISEENAFPGRWPRGALGRPPPTASNMGAGAALTKLAQIESRIRSRRSVPSSVSDAESDSKPTDDEGLPKRAGEATWPRTMAARSSPNIPKTSQKRAQEISTSQREAQTGKGSRFLKKKGPPAPAGNRSPSAPVGKEKKFQTPRQKEPARKLYSPDSDEEEMKELLGSLMDSSGETEIRGNRGFISAKIAEKEHERVKPFLDQIPAQPSLSPPGAELPSSKPLRTWCPSAPGSRAGSPAPYGASLSVADTFSESLSSEMGCIRLASSPGRSEAGPPDESGSEAADSLDDFRINILSLDDLAPFDSERSELGQEEGAQRERPWSGSCPPVGQKVPRRAGPRGSGSQGEAASVAGGPGLGTASELSEHLSASSGESSARTAPGSLAYSEDFESSSGLTTSELAAPSRRSPDRTLATCSEFSSSLQTDLVPRPPPARRKRGEGVTRVLVKETAVQTLDPAFAYQWAAATGMAAVGPALGGAYVDPVPIASHVVSADAVEALTAYSPAALALNDLLKQQLSLTRQFVEASRQLHGALLRSLEGDSFRYHTLEEAKEYIRCHRPTPLTLEEALQQVKEEL